VLHLFGQLLIYVITLFSRVCHLPYPESDEFSSRLPMLFLRSSSILFSHLLLGLPKGLFPPHLNFSLYTNTFSLCSSLNVRGQVSHHYKITGKSVVLNVCMFTVLGGKWEEKASDLRFYRTYFGKNFSLCDVMHVCLITTASGRFVSAMSEH